MTTEPSNNECPVCGSSAVEETETDIGFFECICQACGGIWEIHE